MVQDKREEPRDDVEIGPLNPVPDAAGAEDETQNSMSAAGTAADNPSETERPHDIANAAASEIDAGPAAPQVDDKTSEITPAPPDVSVPGSIVAPSLINPAPQSGGISFGDFTPVASDDDEPFIDGADELPPLDLPQAFSPGSSSGEPASSGPGDDWDRVVESRPDPSSPVRRSPLVLDVGRGAGRAAKRLEIEVEITVTNTQRITEIAVAKARKEFKGMADDAVYKVENDFRRFRESYRSVWGRW